MGAPACAVAYVDIFPNIDSSLSGDPFNAQAFNKRWGGFDYSGFNQQLAVHTIYSIEYEHHHGDIGGIVFNINVVPKGYNYASARFDLGQFRAHNTRGQKFGRKFFF